MYLLSPRKVSQGVDNPSFENSRCPKLKSEKYKDNDNAQSESRNGKYGTYRCIRRPEECGVNGKSKVWVLMKIYMVEKGKMNT